MIPGPMEYLKSHAIAFLSGVLAATAVQLYGSLQNRQRRKSHSN